MTKDEALRMAVAALKKSKDALAEELAAWDIDPPLHHVLEAHDACEPAIKVCEEALAQETSSHSDHYWAHEIDMAHIKGYQQGRASALKELAKPKAISQLSTPTQKREHITDGSPCWCNPETNYVDPETGIAVIVHKEPQ